MRPLIVFVVKLAATGVAIMNTVELYNSERLGGKEWKGELAFLAVVLAGIWVLP